MNSSAQAVLGYLHSMLSHPRGEQDNDRELLRRFLEAHDDDAFALLVRRHGPMVLGLACRVLGDRHLAEDVFQAAFLLLARKAHTIRRAESLSCWLHGVAFRLALRVRRSQERRQQRESHLRPASSPSALEELTAQELLTVLDDELHQLPENQRAPLILCCLEGLSQEEAARRLGCSPGSIKGRLERGRQRLRIRLEKRGLTLPAALGGTLLIAGSTSPVPAALVKSALQSVTTGAIASPAVAALTEEAMRMMVASKFRALSAVVLLLAVTGTGVGMMALRPPAAEENAPAAPVANKPASSGPRVDLHGDPMPQGAAMRLGTVQRRAVGAQIAVTADGKTVLSVRAGKYLRSWDAETGKLRTQRELPGDSFNSMAAFSPDGRFLAIHNDSAFEVRIWDVATGKIIQTLPLFSRDGGKRQRIHVRFLAFSPDGEHIAALEHDGKYRIRLWKTKSGEEIFRQDWEAGLGVTDRLMLAGEGKRLYAVFVSVYTSFRCWDIATGRQVWQNENLRPYTIVVTPDCKILLSGQGSQAQTVDLATGQTMDLKNPLPIDRYAHLNLMPDGRTLLVADEKGVDVWDWQSGKKVRTLHRAGEEIVVHPDGKSIIANSGALQRWDLTTGKPLWTQTFDWGHVGEVLDLAFSADGKRLASGSADGTVRLWDAATGQPLRVWRGHQARRPIAFHNYREAGVQSVDITPNGRWILSAGSDDRLKLWDANADKEAGTIVAPKGAPGLVIPLHYKVRINSEGNRATALYGCFAEGEPPKCINKLATWNAKTGELLVDHSIQLESGACYSLSPDGGLARMWNVLVDAASGKEMVRLPEMRGNVGAISRDGSLVAGIARDNSGLHVYESVTGGSAASLKAVKWTSQVAFHPDNHILATNDLDGIQLWDLRNGARGAQFRTPEPVRVGVPMDRNVCCVAFTPDGRRLATGMPDGTILMWDILLPPSKPQRLEPKEIESLWADLADADAAKTWRAVWRLADAPNDALTLLHARVRPYPTAPAEVTRKLLADLDSDSFEVREAAVKQLQEMGLQAEPALREALQAKPPLEQRRRIEAILAGLSEIPEKPATEELRQLRALIVLERMGTVEARGLLREVAQGPPSARLTRQAQACLACLQ